MSKLVIVAIPERDDSVWKISSEIVPHLTLLHLGESSDKVNVFEILKFLGHAASSSLTQFSLDVDRRDTLGKDDADVLFFEGWDLPDLKRFRGQLLQNDNIKKAFLASDQFPEWLPHLTLGYPDKPAKELKDEYSNRIYSVRFDRIALWVDDYTGPTFMLKRYVIPEEMAMSVTDGKKKVDEILHYGVKGMRWGKSKSDGTPTPVVVTRTPKGKIKTEGGKNQPAHDDAIKAKVAVAKAKGSGLQALSNQELQVLATRINLEKQVSNLASDELASTGRKFVNILMDVDKAVK